MRAYCRVFLTCCVLVGIAVGDTMPCLPAVTLDNVVPASRGCSPVAVAGNQVNNEVRSADGTIWAYGSDQLYQWRDGLWVTAGEDGVDRIDGTRSLRCSCAGPGSSIYCLWTVGQTYALTCNDGMHTPIVIARFPIADYVNIDYLSMDHGGRIWIFGYNRFFWCVDPADGSMKAFEFQPGWRNYDYPGRVLNGPDDQWQQDHVEDTGGRMWIYSMSDRDDKNRDLYGLCCVSD